MEELRIVKMTEKLAGHPMFSLLMDQGLGIAGALSSSFGVTHVVQGESAFEAGRKAEALFITQSGEFFLHLPRPWERAFQLLHQVPYSPIIPYISYISYISYIIYIYTP